MADITPTPAPIGEVPIGEAMFSLADTLFGTRTYDAIADEQRRLLPTQLLLFLNMVTLNALFLAGDGAPLSIVTLSAATSTLLLVAVTLCGGWYLSRPGRPARERWGVAGLLILALDLSILSPVIFDSLSPDPVSIHWLTQFVAFSLFLSLPLTTHHLPGFLAGKTLVFGSLVFVAPIRLPPEDSLLNFLFPMIFFAGFIMLVGYWLYCRQLRSFEQRFALEALQATTRDQATALATSNAQLEEQLDLRRRLIGFLGHDLRQPINAANLMLYALDTPDASEDQRQTLAKSRNCLSTADQLINELMVYSTVAGKPAAEQLSPVRLDEIFDGLADEFTLEASSSDVDLRFVRSSASVLSDEESQRRLLRNLIQNALTHADPTRIVVGARRRGERLAIMVVDNGKGMATLPEASSMAGSRRRAGSANFGMGYAIIHMICNRLDHELSFRSTPDRGTAIGVLAPRELRATD